MDTQTEWQFFLSTKEAWQEIIKEIEEAKKGILFEQFLIENDNIGRTLFELLIKKAKEGLKVEILCDMVGSFSFYNSKYPRLMREAGAEVIFFNSVIPFSPNAITIKFFRDHRRSLIIDSNTAFTGGYCFVDRAKNWRETTIKIKGDVTQRMTHAFEEIKRIANKKKKAKNAKNFITNEQFDYLTHSPTPKKRFLYNEFKKTLSQANSHIYLTTPYFAPGKKILNMLTKISKRGIRVCLLAPKETNHYISTIASRSFFENLLRSGIEIYLYHKEMIHAKTAVIDGKWSMVGSLNLDILSFRHNFESAIVSHDRSFSKELEQIFLNDLSNSKKLELKEWQDRPLRQKMLEKATRPIRNLLLDVND